MIMYFSSTAIGETNDDDDLPNSIPFDMSEINGERQADNTYMYMQGHNNVHANPFMATHS